MSIGSTIAVDLVPVKIAGINNDSFDGAVSIYECAGLTSICCDAGRTLRS